MTSAKEKYNAPKTARETLDRATLDALVVLFLLRDGLVLPDELQAEEPNQSKAASRELILYAELSGLLKDGIGERAHTRLDEDTEL